MKDFDLRCGFGLKTDTNEESAFDCPPFPGEILAKLVHPCLNTFTLTKQ